MSKVARSDICTTLERVSVERRASSVERRASSAALPQPMSRKRPLERLPFLSPAFPGQAAPLLVTPPGAADKAAADKAADNKQYYSSSALTTPDTKTGPLP